MNKKGKILLIDDDVDLVAATRTILEKSGYEAVTANRVDEGIELARKEKPDLVLLDVIMPVKDGFTAADLFKNDPQLKSIPIVMLTAFSSKGSGSSVPRGKGLYLEADDYLEKPVQPDLLLSTIAQHLRK